MAPVDQPKADGQGAVDAVHGFGRNFAHSFPEAFFIDGADLFEKDGRVLLQAAALGRQFDMGRELCLVTLAGDGSCDHGGAVPIADIVLDDENRSDAALLRADDRGKICIINFTPFDGGV